MRLLALALVVVIACDRSSEPHEAVDPGSAPAVEPTSAAVSDPLIAKFQCTRCHDVPGAAPAERDKHCFRCHQQIHDGTFEAKPETLARWRDHVQSLRHAPSLAAATRLRRAWVQDFLQHPHDVRPNSIAMMPRLAITEPEARRLAALLVPVESAGEVVADPALIARGEQLYRSFACARCHRFTGAAVDDRALTAAARLSDEARRADPDAHAQAIGWTLAPDLRFARARVQPAALAAWIERPGGAMPAIPGIGRDEARALAAFVVHAPLAELARPTVPERLPVLTREVRWEEVSAKVFHDVCWHCHAVPDFARGDGGPGNSGGFGFAPRGLDLSSYVGISEGAFDDDGERHSIFARLPDGTPRLVAHLMARHVEAAGGTVEGIRGMPLGLPPLSLEQIQLVESWIVQGRPQ